MPQNYVVRDANVGEGAVVPYEGDKPAEAIQHASQDLLALKDRQLIYGNVKLGEFEEEISGINLSKLFSVYGPQSAQGRKRSRKDKSKQVANIQTSM